jgi:hypothetical protein
MTVTGTKEKKNLQPQSIITRKPLPGRISI